MEEQTPQPVAQDNSKSLFITWIFGWLFGSIGLDRFYLRQIWTGILKLITFGGFGIWIMYDLLYTAFGKRKDKQGRPLSGTAKERRLLRISTVLILVLQLVLLGHFVIYGIPAIKNDTYRRRDAESIQNTLVLFQKDVSSSLPQQAKAVPNTQNVQFCGSSCDDGSIYIDLKYYKADKVFIKEYTSGLVTPTEDSVVVMTNATCEGPKAHYMAVVYVTEGFGLSDNFSERHCLTVEPHEFTNIAAPPTCNLEITQEMPTATQQFVTANLAYNKLRQDVTNVMQASGSKPTATPTSVDMQLVAEKQFLAELNKINFPAQANDNAAKLKTLTQEYITQLVQLRGYLASGSTIPESLSASLTKNAADHSAAYLSLKNDLKLPESKCRFLSP